MLYVYCLQQLCAVVYYTYTYIYIVWCNAVCILLGSVIRNKCKDVVMCNETPVHKELWLLEL
jgi:hypothetical protein